MERKYLY